MCTNYTRCGCDSCPTYNPSNKTMVIPVEGVSWLTAYRTYHPEDTRTDQEIIDSNIHPPAVFVPNSAVAAPALYTQAQVQGILDELRAIKTALIEANLMLSS